MLSSLCTKSYQILLSIYDNYRNEEYICYIDHIILRDLFVNSSYHVQAVKIQSLYVIHCLIERFAIEKIPRSRAIDIGIRVKQEHDAERGLTGKKSKNKTASKRPPDAQNEAAIDRKLSTLLKLNFDAENFMSNAISRVGSEDEDEKVNVLTVRACGTNGESSELALAVILCQACCVMSREVSYNCSSNSYSNCTASEGDDYLLYDSRST